MKNKVMKDKKAQVMWGTKDKQSGEITDAYFTRREARFNRDRMSVVKVEVKEIKGA